MVRIVTILLSVICTAETVFSQVVVTCLKKGPDMSCQDMYGDYRTTGCPLRACVPSFAGGPGWGCDALLVNFEPGTPQSLWDQKQPTFRTPIHPETGKVADVGTKWTCAFGRPCSGCIYLEESYQSICGPSQFALPIEYGWTIHNLTNVDCPGVHIGGPTP